MREFQIESIEAPFDRPEITSLAARVLTQADAMGLLEGLVLRRLDESSFGLALKRIASAGVGKRIEADWAARRGKLPPKELEGMLASLTEDLEMSALPSHEWSSVDAVLGTTNLARLLGISPVTLRRYRSRARATPDAVANRLHFIALLVGELAGAYNDFGIRRWFERPRAALEAHSPAELLAGDWSPEDPGPRRLRELVHSLTASPAT